MNIYIAYAQVRENEADKVMPYVTTVSATNFVYALQEAGKYFSSLNLWEWEISKLELRKEPQPSELHKDCNHHHELTDQYEMVDCGTGEFVANKQAIPLLKALHEVGLKTRTHHIADDNNRFISILLDNATAEIKTVNEIDANRTQFNGKQEVLIQWKNEPNDKRSAATTDAQREETTLQKEKLKAIIENAIEKHNNPDATKIILQAIKNLNVGDEVVDHSVSELEMINQGLEEGSEEWKMKCENLELVNQKLVQALRYSDNILAQSMEYAPSIFTKAIEEQSIENLKLLSAINRNQKLDEVAEKQEDARMRFMKLVKRLSEGVEITDETYFINDLGFESLDYVQLMMHTEKEFNISIPDPWVEHINTFGQAMELLLKMLNIEPTAKVSDTTQAEQSSERLKKEEVRSLIETLHSCLEEAPVDFQGTASHNTSKEENEWYKKWRTAYAQLNKTF